MKHQIEIDLHEAKKSIDDICILGAMIKDEDAKKRLKSLNDYLQNIWSEVLAKQNKHNQIKNIVSNLISEFDNPDNHSHQRNVIEEAKEYLKTI